MELVKVLVGNNVYCYLIINGNVHIVKDEIGLYAYYEQETGNSIPKIIPFSVSDFIKYSQTHPVLSMMNTNSLLRLSIM